MHQDRANMIQAQHTPAMVATQHQPDVTAMTQQIMSGVMQALAANTGGNNAAPNATQTPGNPGN